MTMSTRLAFDLVVATIGRTTELGRLLGSVEAQAYGSLRVLVVDQNGDDRLDPILASFLPRLSIVRLRSEPGLSRARNVALGHLEGDVVAFPDDDCWYPAGLLERVASMLAGHPEWGGISVRARGDAGRPSSMLWDSSPGGIDRFNIWRRALSAGVFLRRALVSAVGPFAEELGAGSGTEWGSGEETDYLLRALEAGFELRYDPSLHIHHESPNPTFDRESSRRAFRMGLGHGRVLRLHRYPRWFAVYRVAQLIAGSTLFLVTGRVAKAHFYFSMAVGRARGWLRSRSSARDRAP